ncbi:hypothetical protein [Planomonospora parontospora]|uniref:hypothetical protein n=1 Tax=Planomonospora parontospora TaxID=58119 RepID=UPI0016716DEE|nr:hypothetical protein [Planomonospora parontospora]
MLSAYSQNDVLLSMMDALVGDGVDLESARKAFESTKGDFAAKFTAAVQARFAQMVRPELFIDIPERPEVLRKADLEALVRPAVDGFLRSHPTRDELLAQADRIRWRQERRPPWIPRLDRHGEPISEPQPGSSDEEAHLGRPLTVTALAELGDVTVLLPAPGWERPELVMMPGGIGEWEAVLCTVLGVTCERTPVTTVVIDAQANEALIPENLRWWAVEPAKPLSAMQDPGVASELLATSASLGGLPVTDSTHQDHETLAMALMSAGDWRYSARWLLDSWDPSVDAGVLATARAAIAGWAGEGRSGLVVYVYGGTLHGTEGLIGGPGPLHSYLLCVSRSADGTDTVDTVHRVILSCPGENWCHRGGCPETDFTDVAALLAPIVTAGDVAGVTDQGGGWAGEVYQQLYGAGGIDEHSEDVLDFLEGKLSGIGWVELDRSTWEGGLEESLLRRGEHCLTASYDPVTHQLQLADGMSGLEGVLDILADDGVLTDDDDQVTVDAGERAVQRWGTEFLTAAEDLLRGRINELRQLAVPVQGALLGLHPHADGTLSAPKSTALADEQLTVLLHAAGLLSNDA